MLLGWAADLSGAEDPTASSPATARKTARVLDPSFLPIEDDPKLPRVLLLGDSISIAYTIPVRELLRGKANVPARRPIAATRHKAWPGSISGWAKNGGT